MSKSVKRSKYFKCEFCNKKIFESKIREHEINEHAYDRSQEPNYIRYPITGFAN